MTIIDNPDSVPSVEEEDSHPESETVLLDLFICCQCSVYCLVSRVIPGVIPLKLMEEFTKEKMDNPRVDVTRRASALQAWETVHTYVHTPPCRVLMYPYAHYSQYIYSFYFQSQYGLHPQIRSIVQNRLFRGEKRLLPVSRPTFTHKVGWTKVVCVAAHPTHRTMTLH